MENRPRSGLALRFSAALALFTMLVTLLVLTSATFAWFTISVTVNSQEMTGSVSAGDVNLLIAPAEGGPYDITSPVTLIGQCEELLPVSTIDPSQLVYAASAFNQDKKAVRYMDVTEQRETMMIHGEVWLKAEYADANLYFSPLKLKFEGDGQALSALRLAVRFENNGEADTFKIFKLDDLPGVSGNAQSTINGPANSVLSQLNGKEGSGSYTTDPALDLNTYFAQESDEDTEPEDGQEMLCTLTADQAQRCEFWIYLEGCDENCINSCMTKDLSFNLGFCGTPQEQA